MTAEEARSIMEGSMHKKPLPYRMRIAYLCGTLNKYINSCAMVGEGWTGVVIGNVRSAQKYFPVMARLYESQGYVVSYNIVTKGEKESDFTVYWDFTRCSSEEVNEFNSSQYHSCAFYRLLGNESVDRINNALKHIEDTLNGIIENSTSANDYKYKYEFSGRDNPWLNTVAVCLRQIIKYMQDGKQMDFNTIVKWRKPKNENSDEQQ